MDEDGRATVGVLRGAAEWTEPLDGIGVSWASTAGVFRPRLLKYWIFDDGACPRECAGSFLHLWQESIRFSGSLRRRTRKREAHFLSKAGAGESVLVYSLCNFLAGGFIFYAAIPIALTISKCPL
jgi:hypothetical protein